MKLLVFHAAHTSTAILVIGSVVSALREAGHSVGERSLPHFKMEKEPADELLLLLTPEEAKSYQDRAYELITVFGEDIVNPIEMPSDPDKLADFDPQIVLDEVEGPETLSISLGKARAEAVERGLEVLPTTTRLELERMLGVDIHPAAQEGDRQTDLVNNANPTGEPRIGVRTSQVLPTVNGLPLSRLNPEQLRAAAAQVGIRTTPTMRRETIISRIEDLYAKNVNGDDRRPLDGGQDGASDQSGQGDNANNDKLVGDELLSAADLASKTNPEIVDYAAKHEVDLEGATVKADMLTAITDAGKVKVDG